jgi:hypothetical protein
VVLSLCVFATTNKKTTGIYCHPFHKLTITLQTRDIPFVEFVLDRAICEPLTWHSWYTSLTCCILHCASGGLARLLGKDMNLLSLVSHGIQTMWVYLCLHVLIVFVCVLYVFTLWDVPPLCTIKLLEIAAVSVDFYIHMSLSRNWNCHSIVKTCIHLM